MKTLTGADQTEISLELHVLGDMIGDIIISKLNHRELSADDEIVLKWIPCVVGEGNTEFLIALANSMCTETEAEIITNFLKQVLVNAEKGKKLLRE